MPKAWKFASGACSLAQPKRVTTRQGDDFSAANQRMTAERKGPHFSRCVRLSNHNIFAFLLSV